MMGRGRALRTEWDSFRVRALMRTARASGSELAAPVSASATAIACNGPRIPGRPLGWSPARSHGSGGRRPVNLS